MSSIFKTLSFKKEAKFSSELVKTEIRCFVPGVNSGVYHPPTLVIQATITTYNTKFLGIKLKKSVAYSSITLTNHEFNELKEQIERIDGLRDNILKH